MPVGVNHDWLLEMREAFQWLLIPLMQLQISCHCAAALYKMCLMERQRDQRQCVGLRCGSQQSCLMFQNNYPCIDIYCINAGCASVAHMQYCISNG